MIPGVNTASNALGTFMKGFASSARNVAKAGTAADESVRSVDQSQAANQAQTGLTQDETAPDSVGDSGSGGQGSGVDIAQEAVQMSLNKTGAEAAIAVLRTADQTVGSLIDIVA